MKPLFPQIEEVIKLTGQAENALCEGRTPVDQIHYTPLSGRSRKHDMYHQVGYFFSIGVANTSDKRQASVFLDTASNALEVTLGWSNAFDGSNGAALKIHDVARPDPIFLKNGEVVNQSLRDELPENSNKSYRFTLDANDAKGAAGLVANFLLNHGLPPVIWFV